MKNALINVISGLYLALTSGLATVSMILSVVVINVQNKNSHPVPRWMKKMLLYHLARLIGLGNLCSETDKLAFTKEADIEYLRRGERFSDIYYGRACDWQDELVQYIQKPSNEIMLCFPIIYNYIFM